MDRTAEAGKTKGGGVCFMINKKWCDPRNISILSCSCSPHLEHISIICRPFYLSPGSFHQSSLLPFTFHHRQILAWLCPYSTMCSADISTNILTLHVSSREDFNKANLRQVMPNFQQHVSCPTRGPNTLVHCYTQFKNACKAQSLPAFGKLDHAAIFLTPEYKQWKWRAGPPTLKLCYRRLLMTWTGTCSGRVHLTSVNSRI